MNMFEQVWEGGSPPPKKTSLNRFMCGHIGNLPLWKDTTENITFQHYVTSGKKVMVAMKENLPRPRRSTGRYPLRHRWICEPLKPVHTKRKWTRKRRRFQLGSKELQFTIHISQWQKSKKIFVFVWCEWTFAVLIFTSLGRRCNLTFWD